ncbi:MAG: arginine--tRNA ligase [Candidatus Moranbacteria bacterium]|nr:arginine--tRNA ligase [Candidatus Moranbacteria bacterium]
MKSQWEGKIREAIGELQAEDLLPRFEVPEIRIEWTRDERHGEFATNAALALSKLAQKPPMELAELIVGKLTSVENGMVEVAAPGYINITLPQSMLAAVVNEILECGGKYGDSGIGEGVSVNNEFVSANPTGPMHLGNGRGGFFGDTFSNVLRKVGFDVTSEYYVNDGGGQVMKLGHSVLRDSEAVYGGEYIDEVRTALDIGDESGVDDVRVRAVGLAAADFIMKEYIRRTLDEKMHIRYDSFISELKDIVEKGLVDRAIAILRERELTYEQDGALMLRTTDFGDDKDRALLKSDGDRTYFASDCGYLLSKVERGADRLVLTLGADHHGYVTRIKAAAQALGFSGPFDIFIVQLVRLVKDGKEVRMSKRAGNVVTIDELVDLVGHDVARFFFLMSSLDSHMNFDLGLAEERSEKNPVYYVQYAHARLSSILRKAEEAGLTGKDADVSLLIHPKERILFRELLMFPELCVEVAETGAVHHLPQYAMRLADRLHSFYADCRVIDEGNPELSGARLALVEAVRVVLAETLRLIGVSAPEKM